MAYCDKHIVKMPLETCQLLCSVHHLCGSIDKSYTPRYKLTHKNHPCSVWTRESLSNYIWLCKLGKAMCIEYTYRYGRVHACESVIDELTVNMPNIKDIGFTQPALAMPDEYKLVNNPVFSYREYYYFGKTRLLSWKGKINGRDVPSWIKDCDKMYGDR